MDKHVFVGGLNTLEDALFNCFGYKEGFFVHPLYVHLSLTTTV